MDDELDKILQTLNKNKTKKDAKDEEDKSAEKPEEKDLKKSPEKKEKPVEEVADDEDPKKVEITEADLLNNNGLFRYEMLLRLDKLNKILTVQSEIAMATLKQRIKESGVEEEDADEED